MYGLMVWLMVLWSPTLAFAGEVPYSAIVLDLSGTATATRLGKSRLLDLGAVLYSQEVVETAAGACALKPPGPRGPSSIDCPAFNKAPVNAVSMDR